MLCGCATCSCKGTRPDEPRRSRPPTAELRVAEGSRHVRQARGSYRSKRAPQEHAGADADVDKENAAGANASRASAKAKKFCNP